MDQLGLRWHQIFILVLVHLPPWHPSACYWTVPVSSDMIPLCAAENKATKVLKTPKSVNLGTVWYALYGVFSFATVQKISTNQSWMTPLFGNSTFTKVRATLLVSGFSRFSCFLHYFGANATTSSTWFTSHVHNIPTGNMLFISPFTNTFHIGQWWPEKKYHSQ